MQLAWNIRVTEADGSAGKGQLLERTGTSMVAWRSGFGNPLRLRGIA